MTPHAMEPVVQSICTGKGDDSLQGWGSTAGENGGEDGDDCSALLARPASLIPRPGLIGRATSGTGRAVLVGRIVSLSWACRRAGGLDLRRFRPDTDASQTCTTLFP